MSAWRPLFAMIATARRRSGRPNSEIVNRNDVGAGAPYFSACAGMTPVAKATAAA
jgi:hypothetical protein